MHEVPERRGEGNIPDQLYNPSCSTSAHYLLPSAVKAAPFFRIVNPLPYPYVKQLLSRMYFFNTWSFNIAPPPVASPCERSRRFAPFHFEFAQVGTESSTLSAFFGSTF